MDKDHRLDAPNDESLRTIEQLNDHSELSTLYFNAHKEWEGKEIISEQERYARADKEQLAATLSIRKWFVIIGFLLPLPFILFVILLATLTSYITADNARSALLAVIFTTGVWLGISFFALRYVFRLFYKYAVKAAPFAIVLLSLTGLCAQASYLLTRPLHSGVIVLDALFISMSTIIASIVLSGALLFIWTSPRLTGNTKVGTIGCIALALLVVIFIATFL